MSFRYKRIRISSYPFVLLDLSKKINFSKSNFMKEKKTTTPTESEKIADLEKNTVSEQNQFLTTNQGLKVNDDHNTLKAGERGPSLLEDFIMREKITHFDHERIPERAVHARGSGAHGYFEVTNPIGKYTKAKFLTEAGKKTPVFVRFSTVAGSRGSSDLARDIRGFAIKFYTEEGIYDMVGNNAPVFFIQDAIKFPDFIHAVKPEPRDEMPQAASAHDTFWDFVSLSPETMHAVIWAMSDRAIPRSYRMMEGFAVHTFRFVNEKGESCFVKFHLKPTLGMHSLCWDEAQKLSGKDADFHRRDLWEAIDSGAYPEWEVGVQIVPEEDEHKYDFDLLDPTKLIPEELVPVEIIGKMVLNRNPDNFFAETEQVAFHPGHIVPGIDFSNDPLLQGRLFSYTDTQLIRLGGPNFHQIPINRATNGIYNNQRDGYMQMNVNKDATSYIPNSIGGGHPHQAMMKEGGFASYQERVEGSKIRGRSKSFLDHYSQAALFFHSQSEPEKQHIIDAYTFELGKVKREEIRERMLGLLDKIDQTLAKKVADGLGLKVPKVDLPENHQHGADAKPEEYTSVIRKSKVEKSPALSMANTKKNTIKTRNIAIFAENGVNKDQLKAMKTAMTNEGAVVKIVSSKLGELDGGIKIDESLLQAASVCYDALFIPDGDENMKRALNKDERYGEFVWDTYHHFKPIAVNGMGEDFMKKALGNKLKSTAGIVSNGNAKDFIEAVKQHRFWERK